MLWAALPCIRIFRRADSAVSNAAPAAVRPEDMSVRHGRLRLFSWLRIAPEHALARGDCACSPR